MLWLLLGRLCDSATERLNHERFWEADGTKPYIRLLRWVVASMAAHQVATGCNCKPPLGD